MRLRVRMSINSINFLTNEKFGSPPSLENFKIALDCGVKFGLSEKHKKFEKNLPHGLDVNVQPGPSMMWQHACPFWPIY